MSAVGTPWSVRAPQHVLKEELNRLSQPVVNPAVCLIVAAGADRLVLPDHLAKNDLLLHHQPKDARTFEFDLRPRRERW